MTACLLIDFGSTYTKLTAVDLTQEIILGTSKSKTTIETSIMDGFYTAKKELLEKIDQPNIEFKHHFACSSARGGFRMIAIGLSPTLTTEAAKRAALGAGTRILKVYSYGLKKEDIVEIETLNPDIILVCGGTNGGNTEGIINDTKLLTSLRQPFPLVVAGNEEAYPIIEELLKTTNLPYYLTENVMPQINVLNDQPTREILRDIFMKKIVEAKGMDTAEKEIGNILMPTPTAVLHAAELLANGTATENGLDSVLVIDIGGATTDLHSIGDGKPSNPEIRMEGLQEPNSKRTVEGDLGMRYSALSLLESVKYKKFNHYLPDMEEEDIYRACAFRSTHPEMVAKTTGETNFDEVMGKIAIETAFNRHAGSYRREPTPSRILLYQTGKDLGAFDAIIGTGGILIHSKKSEEMMAACLRVENDSYLKPIQPNFYLDQSYILSAMGLLSDKFPDIALRILKKYLVKL
ncbi:MULTISPECIES: methylaspartate mutase accessory protein GlmL [Vagococcus]|uniref:METHYLASPARTATE MUTASE n=1 Tax=Vagococcus fluvialis bH819 TaxID=1255619 RepID=A0A1X6WK85_9ENTE|nr:MULTISPECIES: methylaspartate mutase accessory protein GlmL [Vagococcus]SLM84668.1 METHYLASPARTATE MUTASE [Vagococcus fluvialis bH819]HCM89868.1 MutL protein [Vagococcus sp.]